jgi:hypothetical protein
MRILKGSFKAYIFYLVILLIIVSPISGNRTVYAAVGDPLVITITSPMSNSLLGDTRIVLSGTYSNVRIKNLLLTASEAGNSEVKISDSNTNTNDWVIDSSNKTWKFTKRLSDGSHNIKIEVKDTASGLKADTNVNLYISGSGIVLSNGKVLYGDDLTNIPKDAKIKFTVTDANPITQIDSLKAVTVKGDTEIEGTASLKDLKISGKNAYSIIFTPSNDLTINKIYKASLNSEYIGDTTTNKVFSKSFKFTTKTNADWDDFDDPTHKTSSNPHGHYTLNTNMCASCHITHNGSNASLDGGSYQVTFNEVLSKDQPVNDPSKNYCMACHDGTINAPNVDNINSKYHHNNPMEYTGKGTSNLKQQESCTSCHNPHSEWSEENPNLLKDHYVYKHKSADLDQNGLTDLKVDSLDTSCGGCHDDYTVLDTTSNTAVSIFDSETFKQGYYEFLQYKKSLTATGNIDDYSLCLSCHTNIKKYYKQTTSQHLITATDGSKLNGLLPCAECHETHGSKNSFLLKGTLGHQDQDTAAFSMTGDIKGWTVEKEKEFCLKCHNGKTSIYGVTGKALSPENHTDPSEACYSCHGTGTTKKEHILSEAHGPILGQMPVQTTQPVTTTADPGTSNTGTNNPSTDTTSITTTTESTVTTTTEPTPPATTDPTVQVTDPAVGTP